MASDAVTQEPSSSGVKSSGGWLRALWILVQIACVTAALTHPIASVLGRHFWVADLISHFQVVALAATLIAVLVTFAQYRRLAFVLGVIAGFQTLPLLQYSGSNPVVADPVSKERLRVLVVNVLHDNLQYSDVATLIRNERPDVVGIVEFNRDWLQGLIDVREQFPYRMETPTGADGLALWFRKPPLSLDQPANLVKGGWGNPVLHATFEFAGHRRHLWLVHPTSPFYRAMIAGNPEVEAIAETVGATGGSRIVMGDMNTTEGSAHFRDFLQISGLRDSRSGFGRQPSWPSDWPIRIAIDHVFLTDDLAVTDRRLGPSVGSDHLPVFIELAPAAGSNSETQSDQAARSSR